MTGINHPVVITVTSQPIGVAVVTTDSLDEVILCNLILQSSGYPHLLQRFQLQARFGGFSFASQSEIFMN